MAPSLDKVLVRRMLDGDERAFEEFFAASFTGLFRFALARLHGNEDAAEEVVQSTLCRAIAKLATYRGEAALFTWLCTFCRREISEYCRRHGRQAVELLEDDAEVAAALDSLTPAAPGPEDALKRQELARLVHAILDRLPLGYADALEWKYVEGLPVSTIAERLAISPKAAESLLTRARNAFRDGFATLGRRRIERTP
jgi:RNA polymerase sigma-70 factor (ECF subfamily)